MHIYIYIFFLFRLVYNNCYSFDQTNTSSNWFSTMCLSVYTDDSCIVIIKSLAVYHTVFFLRNSFSISDHILATDSLFLGSFE